MLTRLRWFVYGALASLGASAYVAVRVKRMRERLTMENMTRAGALTVADAMEASGQVLLRTADRSNSARNRDLSPG
jgi:hypothetical protein